MRLKPERLPAELARGLAPVWLVSGDEHLLVEEACDAIRAAARKAGYADRVVYFIDRQFDWDTLARATQSLSLFAERRVFDLRLPSGKPEKGAAVLIDLATRPPPDVICLVVAGELDTRNGDPAWVRAFERQGMWVQVPAVGAAALPDWVRTRAAALHADLDAEAAEVMVERVEGNLLAANQELEKLVLLARGARIGAELVMQSVADSARFDVRQLGEAAAAGDAERALRVLSGLKSEGVEPTLVLWALTRVVRGLWQARERRRLRSSDRSGWNLAAPPGAAAEARMGKMPLARLLRQAHHTDRVIKGQAGGDAWTALTGLTAALAGALQATVDSGRVSA